MRRVLVFTVFDRLDYLAKTLESWSEVRGLERWDVVFRIEPGPAQEAVRAMIWQWADVHAIKIQCSVNPERYGVLHHPWVAFEEAFEDPEVQFVVRAEDDLIVSSDILEYFEWASWRYARDMRIATVLGCAEEGDGDAADVAVAQTFCPWIWGVWRESWIEHLRDTWDHDYSTFNDTPGHQAGWDWNLNTRVFPQRGLFSAVPLSSRVDNIGVFGVHGTEGNFKSVDSFVPDRAVLRYRHAAEWSIVQA